MEKENNKPQMVPVQYVPINNQCEEDEIDLRELFQIIWKNKIFIMIFTIIITLLGGIYAFSKTPIYEIKANVEVGYIGANEKYLLNPKALKIYIKNNFDNSNSDEIKYPKVDIDFGKHSDDILNITINDFSNKEAIEYLNKILLSVKEKEDKKLNNYIDNIKLQINISENYSKELQNQIKELQLQLKKVKDVNFYKIILDNINANQKDLLSTKLQISQLQNKISSANITPTKIIGKIEQHKNAIKPKKKLIVIVSFVTSFILSIFIVFFMEFIRSFKEEK
jgi:uncharacterized protein involved in exopolysaccharide biosynthesis